MDAKQTYQNKTSITQYVVNSRDIVKYTLSTLVNTHYIYILLNIHDLHW